jgi:hypothetical protein
MSAAAEAISCNKSAVSRHMSNRFPKKVAEWVKPEATKEETFNVINELTDSYNALVELCESYRYQQSPDLVSVAVRLFGERRKHSRSVSIYKSYRD